MRLRAPAVLALTLSVLQPIALVPRIAWGAPSATDADRADALKKRGDEAMDSLRYADAVAAYAQAYAITKNPSLLYNQARAHQALGDYASALDFLERFDGEAPPDLKSRVPGLSQLIDDVRARVTRLTVRSNVPGAQVVLRDRVLGRTPLPADVRVTSGHATISVTADGYKPFTREMDLAGGGAVAVDAQLVPKESNGILAIRASVDSAHISVDGNPVGQSPVEVPAPAGEHLVRADSEGLDPVSTSVMLANGERREINLTFERSPPITARWWFWTGIAVVAAGATATVIALTTEKSAPSGSLAPGRVSAPLVSW